MNFWFQWFGVFLITALIDVFWTLYIGSVAEKKALPAANASAIIIALGGITVLAYTNNPILLTASVLGAFIGTYITVRFMPK